MRFIYIIERERGFSITAALYRCTLLQIYSLLFSDGNTSSPLIMTRQSRSISPSTLPSAIRARQIVSEIAALSEELEQLVLQQPRTEANDIPPETTGRPRIGPGVRVRIKTGRTHQGQVGIVLRPRGLLHWYVQLSDGEIIWRMPQNLTPLPTPRPSSGE